MSDETRIVTSGLDDLNIILAGYGNCPCCRAMLLKLEELAIKHPSTKYSHNGPFRFRSLVAVAAELLLENADVTNPMMQKSEKRNAEMGSAKRFRKIPCAKACYRTVVIMRQTTLTTRSSNSP